MCEILICTLRNNSTLTGDYFHVDLLFVVVVVFLNDICLINLYLSQADSLESPNFDTLQKEDQGMYQYLSFSATLSTGRLSHPVS